ncbi:MAG: hypothetical protein KatS3mg035_0371 [Bacteroidia bacterium]|nr:MAG: hypothetical protein KatS3mg035_0371 [Bacteroidia bacterium]
MKTLKILSIDFANPVHDYEIPAYRAAIAHKIGEGNLLFHHHLDENHLLRRYPLIQYKRKNQNLSIIFFEEATEFIYKFLNEEEWKIRVGQEEKILRIQKINIYQSNMSFSKEKIDYKISNWLALNEQNYKTYKNLKSLSEKVAMLERILIAHIIAFAEGIQWTIDRPIELNIIDIHKEKWR